MALSSTETRISLVVEFVIGNNRQLMLGIDGRYGDEPLPLGLSSLMQFLYGHESQLSPYDADFCYLLAKLLKKAQIGNDFRYVVPSETDMAIFFSAVVEQRISAFWRNSEGRVSPLRVNSEFPISITVEDQKGKLVCTMIGRDEWLNQPSGWLTFSVDRKRIWFCNGVVRTMLTREMEQFIGRFLDHPKVHLSGNEATKFIQSVYKPNKSAIIWQVRADLNRFIPHEVHPEPILNIDYENGMLTLELRYKYGKFEITPHHDSPTIPSPRGPIKRMVDMEGIFQSDLIELFTENNIPLALTSPGDIAKFFDVLVPELKSRRWQVRSRAPEFKVNPTAHEINFALSGNSSDWFYFEPNCTIDGQQFSLQEIARLIVDNQGYVQTGSGFVRLSDQSQKELKLLSDNGALRVGKKFNGADILPLIASTSVSGTGKESESLVDRLKKLHSVGHTDPGPAFQGTLRDYQQYGVNWMYFLYQAGLGGVLADDMGLGKTVQTIAFTTRVEAEDPILIVGPTNVIYNWQHELKQFVPKETVLVYTGSNRESLAVQLLRKRYVITSYGVLKNDIELLKQVPFSIIIADEAQALKNPLTQVSKAIKQLNGQFRLALSGTPVENHLMDLWNLFDFVMPEYLGGKKEFDIQIKDEATDKIRMKIKPFILRREKREVLSSLPEKTEILIRCPLTDGQSALYRTILEAAKKGIRDSTGKTKKLNILTSLLKLRQVCTHPQLLPEMSHLAIESAKFDIAKEKISELVEEGHKVVLFSQFTKMLDIFQKWTESEGLYTERIDGSVTGRNRQDAVDRFQESQSAGIFLISLKAGGVGINLTAADYVIHIDPWWNPAIESQATDRVHRMGQKNKVFVYKLIAEGTIEEKIAELQETKRELLASVIDIDSINEKQIDLDEIQAILMES